MILTVPIDDFAETVKRHTKSTEAYVSVVGGRTLATAIDADRGLLLRAETDAPADATKQKLTKSGLKVHDGHGGDPSEGQTQSYWIGAVAYKSVEETPGLWVHAFASKPSTGQVLSALYEEFRESGDVNEVPLEEFIRLADPNVVVLGPDELADFASKSVEEA